MWKTQKWCGWASPGHFWKLVKTGRGYEMSWGWHLTVQNAKSLAWGTKPSRPHSVQEPWEGGKRRLRHSEVTFRETTWAEGENSLVHCTSVYWAPAIFQTPFQALGVWLVNKIDNVLALVGLHSSTPCTGVPRSRWGGGSWRSSVFQNPQVPLLKSSKATRHQVHGSKTQTLKEVLPKHLPDNLSHGQPPAPR